MAILPILGFDHPMLRTKTKKVSRLDDSVIRLLDELAETMLDAPGAGLAAPQVALALSEAHVTGPHRTLMQDPVFAIDSFFQQFSQQLDLT